MPSSKTWGAIGALAFVGFWCFYLFAYALPPGMGAIVMFIIGAYAGYTIGVEREKDKKDKEFQRWKARHWDDMHDQKRA